MKLTQSALFERIGREAVVVGVCFLIAQLINVLAIVLYKTEWRELYTQAGWLAIFTAALYVVSIIARLVVPRLVRRKTS